MRFDSSGVTVSTVNSAMLRTQYLLTALVAALVTATPGRAQSADASAECEPVTDTLRFGTAAIYRECAVEKPAKLKKSSMPNFQPPSGLRCVRADIEFVVDSTGEVRKGSAKVVRTTSEEYATLLLETLNKWRYDPARVGKQAVSQLVTLRDAVSFTDARGRVAYTVGGGSSAPRPTELGIRGTPTASCDEPWVRSR